MIIKYLRGCIVLFLIKPFVFLLLGVNTHHRERLPKRGPAIIVANHNSHLDTAILMSLFPVSMLPHIRPVAAADYFLRNPLIAWFSTKIVGILPISRHRMAGVDPFENVHKALADNSIVIFYPEGTRGEPNHLAKLKSGIAHLASQHPNVDIIPIFIEGTGKALPKGEALLVPFVVDIKVHEKIHWQGCKEQFMQELSRIFMADEVKMLEKSYV